MCSFKRNFIEFTHVTMFKHNWPGHGSDLAAREARMWNSLIGGIAALNVSKILFLMQKWRLDIGWSLTISIAGRN